MMFFFIFGFDFYCRIYGSIVSITNFIFSGPLINLSRAFVSCIGAANL